MDFEGIVYRFPVGSGDVWFPKSIAGVEDSPAFHSVDTTWVHRREVMGSERESDHSLPSSAEVKNEWSYTSTPINTHFSV